MLLCRTYVQKSRFFWVNVTNYRDVGNKYESNFVPICFFVTKSARQATIATAERLFPLAAGVRRGFLLDITAVLIYNYIFVIKSG